MKKLAVFGILMFTWVSSGVCADDVWDAQFEQAASLYQAGDYSASAKAWEQLLAQKYESPALYYNLGASSYRLGQLGRAIWAFERAMLLNPRDKDARWNLGILRKKIQDKENDSNEQWVLSEIRNMMSRASTHELARVFQILLLGWSLMIVLYALSPVSRGFVGRFNGIMIIALCVTGALLGLRWTEVRHPQGIVNKAEVSVRYGPTDSDTKAFILHEGSKVQILKESSGWYFVQFSGRQSGWLPEHTVLKI
jgi:tetratricopeptide (TPR) repeat protein